MKMFVTSPNTERLDEEIERLYQRRMLLEGIISSLERYEESTAAVRHVRLDSVGLASANAGSLAS